MTTQTLNKHPRLVTALQLALLLVVFQGVLGTTPTGQLSLDAAASSSPAYLLGASQLIQADH